MPEGRTTRSTAIAEIDLGGTLTRLLPGGGAPANVAGGRRTGARSAGHGGLPAWCDESSMPGPSILLTRTSAWRVTAALGFLDGDGEGGRAHPPLRLVGSPFGPPQNGPLAIGIAVSLCLHSSFPIAPSYWRAARSASPALQRRLGGGDHGSASWALGRPAAEVRWRYSRHLIGAQLGAVLGDRQRLLGLQSAHSDGPARRADRHVVDATASPRSATGEWRRKLEVMSQAMT